MHHLTNFMLLVGAIILISGIVMTVMVVRALIENRRENAAPFRDYFGPQYDRDLLRHSEFSESEDWQSDPHSRFAPFRLRDPDIPRRFTRVSSTSQQSRERN